jgi:ABC-type transport system substrate-binding protein
MRNDIPPFNDVRVRRAMSMAIDREGIVKGVYRGFGNILGVSNHENEGALKPKDFPPEARKYLLYNPAEAKKLLAEAGHPNGLKLEAFGTLAHGTLFARQLEAFPGMAKPAGFEVTLKVGDINAYNDASRNWRYGTVAVIRHSAQFPLETFLTLDHGAQPSDSNRSAVKDREYDRILDKMNSAVDARERLELAKQAQVRAVDQALFVQYPSLFDFFAISKRLQGVAERINSQNAGGTGYARNWVFLEAWVAD